MDKILGLTPEERGEIERRQTVTPPVDQTVTESKPDAASHAQSRLVTAKKENRNECVLSGCVLTAPGMVIL